MSFHQDGAAGGLVYASGLHAYDTVLNDIHDTDTMLAAQSVQLGDDLSHRHFLAVYGLGNAGFEGHSHILGLIGSLFRAYTQNQQVIVVGLAGRILQLQTFVADVPQVAVTAVTVVSRERQVDAVSLAVLDLVFTGLHGPNVGHSPGSDDLQIGSQSLDTQLETDLVVTLTGSAVADGGSAFLAGYFYQSLGDGGTSHRST